MPDVSITETSLTVNQEFGKMQNSKLKWKGLDD